MRNTLIATTVLSLIGLSLSGTLAVAQTAQRAAPNQMASTPTTAPDNRAANVDAASGNGNQAVATTSADAPAPARGANSFTEGEARKRIEARGFSNVSGLAKDTDGVWRGSAQKGSQQAQVWLDYKGNVGQQ